MLARSPCDTAVIASRDGAQLPRNTGAWVLTATILGSSMVFIDGSAVNVILPVLQSDLRASAVELQWIVVGYALFLSSLMLAGGALGDRLGRRRIFVAGAIVFAAASAVCGAAPGAGVLVLARCVQGIGSALLTPGSLSLIGACFDERSRGKAIGAWSSFTAMTAAIGPGLGGWLAQTFSWRWVFYINVPLAIAVVAIATLRVPESSDGRSASGIDWLGATLCTAGLGAIAYALTFASVLAWTAPSVVISLVIGCAALVAFFVVERRVTEPMLPLELFASRTFAGANVLTFALYAALSALMYFLPFRMIQIDGYSPTAAGFSFLPFIILIFTLSPLSGSLVPRIGARPLLVVGPLITAAACAMLAEVGSGAPYWTSYFPAIVTLGLGMAFAVAPLTSSVMGSVNAERVGAASGVNNAVSRIAGLLAIAAFGSVMVAAFSHALDAGLTMTGVSGAVHDAVMAGRLALAQAPIPQTVDAATRASLHATIDAAYISAFRVVMVGCCVLAALSSIAAAVSIDRRRA